MVLVCGILENYPASIPYQIVYEALIQCIGQFMITKSINRINFWSHSLLLCLNFNLTKFLHRQIIEVNLIGSSKLIYTWVHMVSKCSAPDTLKQQFKILYLYTYKVRINIRNLPFPFDMVINILLLYFIPIT